MEFTVENYSFKKAMQSLLNNELQPILSDNHFVKYKKNHFVREKEGLAQLISFAFNKYELYVYAYFMPIFVPKDWCINFSVEIEHPWIQEKSWIFGPTSAEIEFHNFQQQHKGEFFEMIREIEESVIPKMDVMNPFNMFATALKNKDETNFRERHTTYTLDVLIRAVDECLSGSYTEGKKQLIELKGYYEELEDLEKYDMESMEYKHIISLLSALEGDEVEVKFWNQYELLCDEMRRVYKLIK